jgi:hypothetical protein
MANLFIYAGLSFGMSERSGLVGYLSVSGFFSVIDFDKNQATREYFVEKFSVEWLVKI